MTDIFLSARKFSQNEASPSRAHLSTAALRGWDLEQSRESCEGYSQSHEGGRALSVFSQALPLCLGGPATFSLSGVSGHGRQEALHVFGPTEEARTQPAYIVQ